MGQIDMTMKLGLVICSVIAFVNTVAGTFNNATASLQNGIEDRKVPPQVIAALVQAGASLLGAGGSSGGDVYNYHGKNINPADCWEDGGGACPNGNCLDHDGPRGILIQTRTVGCKWYCFHRGDCKKQICCKSSGPAGKVCARMYEHHYFQGKQIIVNAGSSHFVGKLMTRCHQSKWRMDVDSLDLST